MALELAEGLRDHGHRIRLVTSSWHNGDFSRRLQERRISFEALPLGFLSATLNLECLRMTGEQLLRAPELLLGYRRFLKKEAPRRIVHTTWHHLLLLWPFLRPERDLFWLHEVIPDRPHYRRLFGGLARRVQCIVAVSHAVARSLHGIGIPEHKIRVIYNGLRHPASCVHDNRRRNGVVRIGIVGQVGEWKGHEDLLVAFSQVAGKDLPVELHIFGDAETAFADHLKRRAKELAVECRVIWHGFVTDQAEIFPQIDICVVPSRSEDPAPLAAVQAAFSGLPVIATDRGGLPEIVQEDVTGFLVAAECPRQLAERLEQLVRDKALRERMGEAARQRAVAQFDTTRFIDTFADLLESRG